MIAIDTNVIVRLLTKDDANQYQQAYNLFETHDVFIADTVILETEWVLRFAYDYKVDEIASAFILLLGLENAKVNHPEKLALAITWHKQGLDFADALHLANSQHCKKLYTFDKKMINKTKQLEGCKVLAPD